MKLASGLFAGVLMAFCSTSHVAAQAAPTITQEEWQAYSAAFVADDGRVVDTANGNISHSEGQGYGLILSVLADDRASFERIWSFTRTDLMVRDDGLAAWKWDPDADPNITDTNNATDGDMLIAYGLARAGEQWSEPSYTDAARTIARTLGSSLLVKADGLDAILPGKEGFDNTDNGAPVLNPSYWVFEILPVLAELDPDSDWASVSQGGLDLLERARAGATGLPADWVQAVDGGLVPAAGFDPEFGYNGIRIPLYLMRAGLDPQALAPFAAHADENGLQRINVETGEVVETLGETGYKLIGAAMACTLSQTPIPEELQVFTPITYYGSTLQLLALDYLRRTHPACLSPVEAP